MQFVYHLLSNQKYTCCMSNFKRLLSRVRGTKCLICIYTEIRGEKSGTDCRLLLISVSNLFLMPQFYLLLFQSFTVRSNYNEKCTTPCFYKQCYLALLLQFEMQSIWYLKIPREIKFLSNRNFSCTIHLLQQKSTLPSTPSNSHTSFATKKILCGYHRLSYTEML